MQSILPREILISCSGSNESVRLGILNRRVPIQGLDELRFFASRYLDKAGASAADTRALAEAMLAQYIRGSTVVAELDDYLPRDRR
ncbi:hypothetical protein D477_011326 [Arthrobacter crystallopoietes BAB-32]|uniref:Uncharacterized protein n=1 Tax=Arthrobacter crystallopoietes BAB-32 TaxID=1246476 RepID=N1V794_9MICC|nr:hypothetical protein D477_011326 [Arthrobacter crystallopoietes BAB-32]